MLPSIDASEVGTTGLIWLFFSYGYALYVASNYISDGSDLLLLVPSMAGLVGSVVLPLLGAVPDAAIMLFSGLGDISEAQETLSVGVGALAGSTIMLLTVPWFLSVFAGRVDLRGPQKNPNYTGKPKLTSGIAITQTLLHTGIGITDEVRHGALIMMITTIPYFLIQVPAIFMDGLVEEVAGREKYWALSGLVICLTGFVAYMILQLRSSSNNMEKTKRIAIMKKFLHEGEVSLSGALVGALDGDDMPTVGSAEGRTIYQSIVEFRALEVPETIKSTLKEILRDPFNKYDEDRNGTLDRSEVKTLLRDFHETISDDEFEVMFYKSDKDGDGTIDFDEFISICYTFITMQQNQRMRIELAQQYDLENPLHKSNNISHKVMNSMFSEEDEEEEDIPEDIVDLEPEEQQAIIKKRAIFYLTIGTVVVLAFSDPMVDVMQQIGKRLNLAPFYVAFVLAPIAANISEVIASLFYAKKKTRKTISISLTALEGAACMNNTFCLSIFMGLIYFRGLAWQYTAETISIVVVQLIIGLLVQRKIMTTFDAFLVLLIFPLSIVLVAVLEKLGFD